MQIGGGCGYAVSDFLKVLVRGLVASVTKVKPNFGIWQQTAARGGADDVVVVHLRHVPRRQNFRRQVMANRAISEAIGELIGFDNGRPQRIVIEVGVSYRLI